MTNSPSYQHLAPAYDQLFPLDPEAVAYVETVVGRLEGQSIVDAGCGTGLLARALADRGAEVFGFDLDADLLVTARTREGHGMTFAEADLRTWSLPSGRARPSVVVSFGNTLPHLTTQSELELFLDRCRIHLPDGGHLLIQILDYDFLERTQRWELPQRRVGGWTFSRRYEVQGELWQFRTSLEGEGRVASNAFPLRPWRRAELERILGQNGFSVTGVYGGFDLCPPGNSIPLVLSARLGLE